MRIRICRVLFVAGFLAGLASSAGASFKLLAPNVGWTLGYGNRLLWTTDGGHDWKNITPYASKDFIVSGIFFLDTQRGWVVLDRGEPGVPHALDFDVASTYNAGASWSIEPLKLPDVVSRLDLNGGVSLSFADATHGLMALGRGVTPYHVDGAVLVTADGGKTWSAMPDSADGDITMVTPQIAWLAGGDSNGELYVTRDGAKSWQRVDLDSPVKTDLMKEHDREYAEWKGKLQGAMSPAEAKYASKWMSQPRRATYAAYELPQFSDPNHGYLSVTYPGIAVLFTTEDGGANWKPDRMLNGIQEGQSGNTVVSAVAGSMWITGRTEQNSPPKLKSLGPGTTVTDTTIMPQQSGVSEMSFINPNEGWVFTIYGRLFATKDGGATWTDITPPRRS